MMPGLFPVAPNFMPGMPGMPFMPMQQPVNPIQTNQQITPEQYAMAQQVAMQNMMHQMYLQYLNHFSNAM